LRQKEDIPFMVLRIENVDKNFGGLCALKDLSLEVWPGEILGLIGPNGSGKTTLFNVVTGFLKPSAGRIIFNGKETTGFRPDQMARRGLVRTFQAINLFRHATVWENLLIAHHLHVKASFGAVLLNSSGAKSDESSIQRSCLEILEHMGLASVKCALAHSLPHGTQRALGVAMALACRPSLMLLDEPLTGMNPEESRLFVDIIREIRDRGITIMIVEHDMNAIMGLSSRIVVLNYGEKIAEGTPHEVRSNPQVVEAYLGSEGS
jgi:branched-chain amino acid transport system ATP-binding protein